MFGLLVNLLQIHINRYRLYRIAYTLQWISLFEVKGACEVKKPELCPLPEMPDISQFQCTHQEKGYNRLVNLPPHKHFV